MGGLTRMGARRAAALVAVVAGLALGGWWLRERTGGAEREELEAFLREALSDSNTAAVRAACTTCHVMPPPDMLPREVWATAIGGMFRIAERRGVVLPVTADEAMAWYVLQAPERLPPAPGRTDAGPGSLAWEERAWAPTVGSRDGATLPAVTHVQMASLLGGPALDVLVSDVATNRVYALRPYAPDAPAVELGPVPNPGRLAVTDLDGDGATDVVVAALGELVPTNDPVGSVVWIRPDGRGGYARSVVADSLGRVADVQAVDLSADGRPDLLVAVFGWQENGGLLWLENQGVRGGAPSFVTHPLDARPGFTDARAADLDGDGRLDVAAVIAQEFQQVMVYWGGDGGFRGEVVFQAPNPDWGYTGLDVADLTGDGLADLIVTNGDNLDLTVAKPYHGVAMLENLGEGRFAYRHLTALYGAHRAVVTDLDGSGAPGVLVAAYLPPTVTPGVPEPVEGMVWLERAGPTHLVRRVLEAGAADYMTLAVGDATGDGRPDVAVGLMDLGVVDPRQARPGPPLEAWVRLRLQAGNTGPASPLPPDTPILDWRAPPDTVRRE